MGVVHERILDNNKQKFYLGKVKKVARKELPTVNDALGNELLDLEIIFNVGELIVGAKAMPLNVTSEINEGDEVIIISFESIFNSHYYYYPVRQVSKDHKTIHMTYGNSEIEFMPVDKTNTDLIIASGKALVILESKNQKVNIKSGYGGIQLNSSSGQVDIKNNKFKLSKLMQTFIDTLTDLTVLTPQGPAKLIPADVAKLVKIGQNFSMLLGDVDESDYDPHLPNDTYSMEFVAKAVGETGIHFLNDEDDSDPGEKINSLTAQLPEDTPPKEVTGAPPESSSVEAIKEIEEIDELCGLDSNLSPATVLSTNFKLGDVTTKPTFPHKLKSQHKHSQQQIACNLKLVALNILEPIKAKYPNMQINSGFRGTPSLKNKISQHEIGQAVDLQFPGMTPKEYLEAAKWVTENILFDQFIFEHGNSIWFHLSFRSNSNRRKLMTMYKRKYETGIKLYYT